MMEMITLFGGTISFGRLKGHRKSLYSFGSFSRNECLPGTNCNIGVSIDRLNVIFARNMLNQNPIFSWTARLLINYGERLKVAWDKFNCGTKIC
jgi:hypothetical protein